MTTDFGGCVLMVALLVFVLAVLAVALLVFVLAVLAAGLYAGGQLGDALSHVVTVTTR